MTSNTYTHLRTLQDYLAANGFERREVDIIQPANLFLERAGDTLIQRLLTFEYHGRLMAFRPEFTAPAMQAFIQEQPHHIARWQFDGSVFADVADDARIQEAISFGAEIIGSGSHDADIEVIRLVMGCLEALGITDWHIALGHAGIPMRHLQFLGLDARTATMELMGLSSPKQLIEGRSAVYDGRTNQLIDYIVNSSQYMQGIGGRTTQDIAERLERKRARGQMAQALGAARQFLAAWSHLPQDEQFVHLSTLLHDDTEALAMLSRWQTVYDALLQTTNEQHIRVEPTLNRDWAYYSDLLFSVQVQGRVIGGGGRYDNLAMQLGSEQATPAVGFALYLSHLFP